VDLRPIVKNQALPCEWPWGEGYMIGHFVLSLHCLVLARVNLSGHFSSVARSWPVSFSSVWH
jgi:hypothetical protein